MQGSGNLELGFRLSPRVVRATKLATMPLERAAPLRWHLATTLGAPRRSCAETPIAHLAPEAPARRVAAAPEGPRRATRINAPPEVLRAPPKASWPPPRRLHVVDRSSSSARSPSSRSSRGRATATGRGLVRSATPPPRPRTRGRPSLDASEPLPRRLVARSRRNSPRPSPSRSAGRGAGPARRRHVASRVRRAMARLHRVEIDQ